MINNKVLNKVGILIVTIAMVITIAFYAFSYSSIAVESRFNFDENWFLILCNLFFVIIVSTDLYNNKKKSKFYKKIMFSVSNNSASLLMFTQIFIFCVFGFGIFVFSLKPSIIQLSTSFTMAIIFIQMTSYQIVCRWNI